MPPSSSRALGVIFFAASLVHLSAQNALYPVTPAQTADAASLLAWLSTRDTLLWQRLAEMTDTFGGRLSGSASLEASLDWIAATVNSDNALLPVPLLLTQQPVSVTCWSRGVEWARLTSPRNMSLHFAGLGMSNSTNGVISAQVLVVRSFDELTSRAAQAVGRIVVFNPPWAGYGGTVAYRARAAVAAAAVGGVAALVRGIGPFSMQTPHTGGSTPSTIAAGSISQEDAAMLQRMQDRGQQPTVSMYMEAQRCGVNGMAPSRNLFIDLPGVSLPNEFVIVSGHIDSWDLATGAMDDGGGALASWHAVRTIAMLGLRPARTIRAILWTNEENGAAGGSAYAQELNATLPFTSIAIESDEGPFTPYQLAAAAHPAAIRQLTLLGALLAPIGAGNVSSPGGGVDIGPMCALGVSGAWRCGGAELGCGACAHSTLA